jgi:hypothetical protein
VNDFVVLKSKTSSRKQTSTKFVPTCFLCGENDHIRPKYPLLKSSTPRAMRNVPKKSETECDTQMNMLTEQVRLINLRLDELSTSSSENYKVIPSDESSSRVSLPKLKNFWKNKTCHATFVAHTSLRCLDSCHWYLDSACSRDMLGEISVFNLFNDYRGGSVTLEDSKRS